MNRQEVFDKIYLHLIEQGRKSVNSDGRCQYRYPDGDKCAIGCLIPDELYTPELEGNGVSMPIIEDVLNKITAPNIQLNGINTNICCGFKAGDWDLI